MTSKFLPILLFISFSVTAQSIQLIQFIPEQKEFQGKDRSSNVISAYCEILSTYDAVKKEQARCSQYYRISSNDIELINSAKKRIDDLNQCHQKIFGKPISQQMVKDYINENPGGMSSSLRIANLLPQPNVNPLSRTDAQRCAEFTFPLKMVLQISNNDYINYPKNGWCERMINK